MSASHNDHAPGYRGIRWNMDWITRPLFGLGLAVVAIWTVLTPNPLYFALLVAAIGAIASFEWHRLVSGAKPFHAEAIVTAVTLAISVLAVALSAPVFVALAATLAGMILSLILALRRGDAPVWQVLGVAYLSLPSIALVALRALSAHGAMVILGLFIIVWATDTGALICGNLIGGPRMAPRLSPSKTWAGTIGGSVVAALAFAGFIAILGGSPLPAMLFAFVFSATAHGGDLFESFVKRRFGIKNSGSIIPGHGGVLDRMDSTLGAGLALAILVFGFHFNPLIGVHV